MKFILRDPEAAYLDTHLWLPKKYWSDQQLKQALQYYLPRTNEMLLAFNESTHHYQVPRNFLSWGAFGTMPYPVYDARFTDFPRVEIKSSVVLDSREPSKTYQREAVDALLKTYDGILTLRCGAGKTVVALHAAAQLGVPILVIVSDKGLAKQWVEEIEEHLGIPRKEIGRIGGDGSPFVWRDTKVTVAIVNTLALRVQDGTLPPEMTKYFGVVIPDEAHLMAAPFFNMALPPFHGRRWGLSATPTRDDGFDSLLQYTIGNVAYQYLMPDLLPVVYFRKLPTVLNMSDPRVVEAVTDSTKALHFGRLYDYFAHVDERVDRIARDVQVSLKEGRQVLILTHSRAMCDALAAKLPTAGVCHGGVGETERLRRIKTMNPVIAIMRLGKQALNKPSLDTLFVCEPFRKEAIVQQTMGRVLRAYSGKKKPSVVFYEDSQIAPMFKLCRSIRRALSLWPANKGGRIPFYDK